MSTLDSSLLQLLYLELLIFVGLHRLTWFVVFRGKCAGTMEGTLLVYWDNNFKPLMCFCFYSICILIICRFSLYLLLLEFFKSEQWPHSLYGTFDHNTMHNLNAAPCLWYCAMKLCTECDSFTLLKSWHGILCNSVMKLPTETGLRWMYMLCWRGPIIVSRYFLD